MRFWLHRGVDGFRLDAASWLIKDDQFRDNPPNPDYDAARHAPDEALLPVYTREQPQVHEVMREIRRVADEQPDRLLLGEIYAPVEQVMAYHGGFTRPELHLPLNMGFAWQCWNADAIGTAIEEVYRHLPAHGWPAWLLSGHDRSRLAWRTQGEQTRIAALLLCTLRGTPVVYYGEEIGMRGVPIPAHEARDPQGRRIGRNRDPERTPMQWNREANAGFTRGVPWLPLGADAGSANVADQSGDPHSLLSLYRRLLQVRSSDRALLEGDFEMVSHLAPLVAYWRVLGDRRVLIVLNFSGEPHEYEIPGGCAHGEVVLSTFLDREHEAVSRTISLRAQEGVIVAAAADAARGW
jgi:alpha-glucosidase